MTETEAEDGTWVTKAELANVRGISVESAERLIRRQRWRRQPGNDGRVRVLVPPDWLRPRTEDLADIPSDRPEDNPPDTSAYRATFETALAAIEAAHAGEVAALRNQLDAADSARLTAQALADQAMMQVADATTRADRAEATVAAERARADQAEVALGAERARANTLRAKVEVLQTEAVEAEAEANRLRTEAAEAETRTKSVAAEAETLRRAEAERRARGLVARLRAAWRRE